VFSAPLLKLAHCFNGPCQAPCTFGAAHACEHGANDPPGHHSANPLTLWLRVPLLWYTSATFAQFPDETRSSIQRFFTSPFTSNHRRVFCGYCGTQLSSWNERTSEEAEHICLTVGSLLDDDQELLGELGFLPTSESSDEDSTGAAAGPSPPDATRTVARSEPSARGAPWFEEIVQNIHLAACKSNGRSPSGPRRTMQTTKATPPRARGRLARSKRARTARCGTCETARVRNMGYGY
jgi:hypothetical protein